MQITRTNKITNEATILQFDEAVDQIIRDTYEAYPVEMEGDVEDWLLDMATVFETQSNLENEEKIEVGNFIYTKI